VNVEPGPCDKREFRLNARAKGLGDQEQVVCAEPHVLGLAILGAVGRFPENDDGAWVARGLEARIADLQAPNEEIWDGESASHTTPARVIRLAESDRGGGAAERHVPRFVAPRQWPELPNIGRWPDCETQPQDAAW
jgi:hypothetical protein